jgi:histidine ammonia-lyase
MTTFELNQQFFSLSELMQVINTGTQVTLGQKAKVSIQKCRSFLDEKVANSTDSIYGINTGFGSLYDQSISNDQLAALQVNLVRSHACGTGAIVPNKIVKTMLLLKAIGLHYGHSGAQVETVERLIYFYNNDIIPVVYEQGSLGASGDLAPLAHIALALIGEGEVNCDGNIKATQEVLVSHGLAPIQLQSKEGLALLNGTQFMSAYMANLVEEGKSLLNIANRTAAMSLEAYDGRIDPFTPSVNEVRNQSGQIEVAKQIKALLQGSDLIEQPKKHVQDPYSFRCIPQVHGASLDALNYAAEIVTREINAVTDNPTIFPDED